MTTTQTRHFPTEKHDFTRDFPLLRSKPIKVNGLQGTRFDCCHISIVPEGHEGRKEHMGPMVPGPWGFTTVHALVIDNSGKSAADRKDAESREISVGEPFTVDGLPGVWAFRSPNLRRLEGDGPKLVEYEADED